MIRLRVEVVSGHYRVPGQVNADGVVAEAPSFPIAPPSTIQGFIESLCGAAGLERGSFRGKYAYGMYANPLGFSNNIQQVHIRSTSYKDTPTKFEGIRIIRVPRFHDLQYCLLIEGPWEDRVLSALQGDIDRFGILSLGSSSDMVSWLDIDTSNEPVSWVTHGGRMRLITKSGRGWDNLSTTYGGFSFGAEPSWFEVSK